MNFLQKKLFIDLTNSIVGYFTAKEHNLKLKTLFKLYDKEEKILTKIESSISDINVIPDESYLLLLKKRLQTIRNHIEFLEK